MDRTSKFIEECGGEREAVAEALATIDRLIGQVQEANRCTDQSLALLEARDRKIAEMSGRLFRAEAVLNQLTIPSGAYSSDPLIHATNVIKSMVEVAESYFGGARPDVSGYLRGLAHYVDEEEKGSVGDVVEKGALAGDLRRVADYIDSLNRQS